MTNNKATLAALVAMFIVSPHAHAADKPKLILQITVDQLRGDLPTRYYDTYVPIVFAGAGLAPQVIYREVQTVDVAVTLSAFMGIKPPSGSAGVPLEEVLAK